jgi:hypothetical protein
MRRRNPDVTREAYEMLEEIENIKDILEKRIKFIDKTGRTDGEYVTYLQMYVRNMKETVKKLYNLAWEYEINVPDYTLEE